MSTRHNLVYVLSMERQRVYNDGEPWNLGDPQITVLDAMFAHEMLETHFKYRVFSGRGCSPEQSYDTTSWDEAVRVLDVYRVMVGLDPVKPSVTDSHKQKDLVQ